MKGCLTFIFKAVGILIGLSIALIFIVVNIKFDATDDQYDYQSDNCLEYRKDVLLTKNMLKGKKIRRSWLDYVNRDFCFEYHLQKNQSNKSGVIHQNFQPKSKKELESYLSYWNETYQSLYDSNKYILKHITDSLSIVAQNQNLDKKQTAEMVVSFVQDIPYSYVYGDYPCSQREEKSLPCVEGFKDGLLTPVQFLYTLIGDCDTRSVLIYLILKELNYDLSIVISREYQHAMVAINLPYQGDYIEHNQSKYYFWETTATGLETWSAASILQQYKLLGNSFNLT